MVEKVNEPSMADIMSAIGGIAERVTAIGARVDSMEEKKDSEKKDSEKEDDKKDGFPENLKKDSEKEDDKDEKKDAKKDGETTPESSKEDSEKEDDKKDAKKDGEGCAEEVAADAKKDAEEAKKDAAAARFETESVRKRMAALEAKLPQDRSDDDHRGMSASQARADAVYEMFGKQAPRFQSGESNGEYRRRLVREFAAHSPAWKTVDVGALPDSAFAVAEEQIYADASNAAKDAIGVEDGGLRMVPGKTRSGHATVDFYGRPSAWMGRFAGSRRYATVLRPNTKREA